MTRNICIFIALLLIVGYAASCKAEQPAMTVGDTDGEVIFSFLSSDACASPVVNLKNFNASTIETVALTFTKSYSNPNLGGYSKNAYFFKKQLTTGVKYSWSFLADYPVGPFVFSVRNLTEQGTARFVVIADMDISGSSTHTQAALSSMDWSEYDGLIHVGDFAYDIQDDNGKKGDDYFNSLRNTIATVPYMVIAGNHENYDNGKLFNFRWMMADYNETIENNFYAVRRGPVWFMFVNYDYLLNFHPDSVGEVIGYLETRFQKAEKDSRIKWRAVVSHRPIYCGDYDTSDCQMNLLYLRPFDELYRKYKVDVLLESHEHFYERLFLRDNSIAKRPTAHLSSSNGTQEFRDVEDPLHVISGCAGNSEIFPDSVTTNSMSENKVVGKECYIDLLVTSDMMRISLLSSVDRSLMDDIILHKTASSVGVGSGYSWVLPILFIAFIVITYFCTLAKPVKHEYERPEDKTLEV